MVSFWSFVKGVFYQETEVKGVEAVVMIIKRFAKLGFVFRTVVGVGFHTLIFAILTTFHPSIAQAGGVVELSLNEAYQMTLESNHEVRIAVEDVEQGNLLQKEANTVLYPQLTATAGYGAATYEDGTDSEGGSLGINLEQTIYKGGRVWVAKKGAEYTLSAAQWGLEFVRQSVLMNLIARSNELLSAEDLLKVREKRVERVEEQLRLAQMRLDLGDTPRTSVLSAQVALSRVLLEKVEAQKDVSLARTRLSKVIGTDLAVRVTVPETDIMFQDLVLQDLIDQALTDRPDLARSRELIKISQQEAEFERRNGRPEVNLSGSYTRYTDEAPFAPESQLGINLTWPFFQGGLVKLQTQEALSRVRQSEEVYGRRMDSATFQVEEAWLTLKTRQAQEQLVVDNKITARENHRFAEARFRLGAASSLEVLDAEEGLAEAENLEVNYKYDTRTARSALLYSIGALDLNAFGSGK